VVLRKTENRRLYGAAFEIRKTRGEEMTIQEAARTALDCQDACNLSGVLASFKEIVHEVIWPEARRLGKGSEWVNKHCICVLFLSKLCSLNGGYYECDYLHASDA